MSGLPAHVACRNCRNQAFSQACALCSPKAGSMSVVAIYRQLCCRTLATLVPAVIQEM